MLLKLSEAIAVNHVNITSEDLPVVQRKNLAYQKLGHSNMVRSRTIAMLLVLLAGCVVAVDRFPPVLSPSVLVNGKAPSSSIVSSNDDTSISCKSESGTPIYWKVPAPWLPFRFSNEILTIEKREIAYRGADSYNGDYTCFTNNTLGTAVGSPIRLQIGVVALKSAAVISRIANNGDTVVLDCRASDSGELQPSSLDSAIDYVWYWQNINQGDGSYGRLDFLQMYTQTNRRIAVDEKNRLYIRNVQPTDFDSSSQQFIGCRTFPGTYVTAQLDVGKYALKVSGTPQPPLTSTLMYSTPNVTVTEGGNFTLACIFNDASGTLDGAVTWNKAYSVSRENGARIVVTNAGQQHNGTWECYYKSLIGRVSVYVNLTPRLSGVTDTYVTTGGIATFTCSYQFVSTVKWYKNDKEVDAGRVDVSWPSIHTAEIRLRNVGKSDIGVYSCEAGNAVATIRMNGRLIVTDLEYLDFADTRSIWISENGKLLWAITSTVAAAVSITVNVMFCTCLYRLRYIRWRNGRLHMTKVCSRCSQMASTDAPAKTMDPLVELPDSSATEIEAPYTSLEHSRRTIRIYEPLSHSKLS